MNPKENDDQEDCSDDNGAQQDLVQLRRNCLRKKISSIIRYTSWIGRVFKTTNFHIPFLLISTYLVLTVIPSITRSFLYLLGYRVPYEWTFFYLCSVRVSYTVDGIIYVFLQRRVRRLLWLKIFGHNRTQNESCSRQSELRSTLVQSNTEC